MDSMVVTVDKMRDFALERDLHEVTFKLSFSDEKYGDIILHTPFVETITQMIQSLVDDLLDIAITVRELEGPSYSFTLPPPITTRQDIKNALGPMKRCHKRTFDGPCTICTCEFTPTQFFRELPCGHFYHKKCIDKWLFDCEPLCPNCRQPVVVDSSRLLGEQKVD
jgi:hypothetical protein